jgi:lipoyl(octanoyl) transferase
MSLIIRTLGQQPYQACWQAMRDFTDTRTADQADELWIVQHPAVFTQGLNGQTEHILHHAPHIPIIKTDRGGQVTYHAPGQLIIYVLIDLKRAHLGVRALVTHLEEAIIELLAHFNIHAQARPDAPGVYVNGQKIASLGLKIRQQKSYHGLALNINMDLIPFGYINPCGLMGMQMTQLIDLINTPCPSIETLGLHLANVLKQRLIDAQ